MGSGNARKPSEIARSIHGDRLRYVYSGMDTGHAPGFAIDRPAGWNNYLFLRFRTPMEILTSVGRGTAEAGDCLVYPPGQPQWYRGRGVPFRDDWMHIEGTAVTELLDRYQIPVGRIFTPKSSEFFPVLLNEMLRAKLLKQPFWEDEIALAFHALVLRLSRALTDSATRAAAIISPRLLAALQSARQAVHQDLARKWSVCDMARLAEVGPGCFTRWHRLVFNATPTDDLIRARVERASWLLKTSDRPLAEIGAECGFSEVYYFIRQFRKRLGMTPGRYRATTRM
jgi:AraC family transcriptional regulator of arabinose operon